jgi:hypothetical protein
VRAATGELFSEGKGVEFRPWIVECTELPLRQEALPPASTKLRDGAGGFGEFTQGQRLW